MKRILQPLLGYGCHICGVAMPSVAPELHFKVLRRWLDFSNHPRFHNLFKITKKLHNLRPRFTLLQRRALCQKVCLCVSVFKQTHTRVWQIFFFDKSVWFAKFSKNFHKQTDYVWWEFILLEAKAKRFDFCVLFTDKIQSRIGRPKFSLDKRLNFKNMPQANPLGRKFLLAKLIYSTVWCQHNARC